MVSKIKLALSYATVVSIFAAVGMFMITYPDILGDKAADADDVFGFVGVDFSQVFLPEDNALFTQLAQTAAAACPVTAALQQGCIDNGLDVNDATQLELCCAGVTSSLTLNGLGLGARSMLDGCATASGLPDAGVDGDDCEMQYQAALIGGVLTAITAAMLISVILTASGTAMLKPLMVATVPAHAGALSILICSIKSLGVKSSVTDSFEKFGGGILSTVEGGALTGTAGLLGIDLVGNGVESYEVEIKSEQGATLLLACGLLMATAAFSTLVSIIVLKKHGNEWEDKGMSASVMA